MLRKGEQINKLTDEELIAELKAKGIMAYGTRQERLDRLKKHYGRHVVSNECLINVR